ncbi:hypothetical protein GY45DRAFT_1341342 [Cubamyces sp. BRFM 1775]|nr:hypothetical protein GY45DRAFT_1341342 [Cubamyces sp. BRFM 1775]
MTSAATAGMKPLIAQPIAPPAPIPTQSPSQTPSQTPQSGDASVPIRPPSQGTFGPKDRVDEPAKGVSEERLQQAIEQAIERLDTHMDQECALVRKELKQEVDRLDGRINALDKSIKGHFDVTNATICLMQDDINGLDNRIDGLEKTMNKRFSDLETRFSNLETMFSDLKSDVQAVLDLVKQGSLVPLVVAQPPSSEGHGTDNAPGPSSPRCRQTLSTKSSNVSLASARKLAHTIRHSATVLARKLSRAKEDEDGAGPSE